MKWLIPLIIGLLVGAACVVGGYLYFATQEERENLITLTFTEAEIQEKIGRKFPKEKEVIKVVKIIIEEPQVKFLGNEQKIQLTLNAKVIIPFVRTDEITGIFRSSVRYNKEDHTLRTSDYTIESLETKVLPKEYEGYVRDGFGFAARQLLDDQIVYTLEADDYKGKLAEIILKEIKIKEGRLEVNLGL